MQYGMYCMRMHVWLSDSQQYRTRLRTIHRHARAAEKQKKRQRPGRSGRSEAVRQRWAAEAAADREWVELVAAYWAARWRWEKVSGGGGGCTDRERVAVWAAYWMAEARWLAAWCVAEGARWRVEDLWLKKKWWEAKEEVEMRGILWEEGPGDVEEEEAAGVEEWEKVEDGDKERESASVHQDEATDAEHEKWACSVG